MDGAGAARQITQGYATDFGGRTFTVSSLIEWNNIDLDIKKKHPENTFEYSLFNSFLS